MYATGYYPHPAVPPCPGVHSVQKEVVYCPDLKFYAFDIAISLSPQEQSKSRSKYMSLWHPLKVNNVMRKLQTIHVHVQQHQTSLFTLLAIYNMSLKVNVYILFVYMTL